MRILSLNDMRLREMSGWVKANRWQERYDISRHLPDGWKGTVLDLLALDGIPPREHLRAVLRPEVLDDRTLRLLACAFVRRTPLGDGRTVWDLLGAGCRRAIVAAERHVHGEASDSELYTATRDALDTGHSGYERAVGAAARAASDLIEGADAWGTAVSCVMAVDACDVRQVAAAWIAQVAIVRETLEAQLATLCE